MKIKTVCDITGLTDRTIRYYIEEQLISPAYTENYLGRKSFDFSQEDIDALKSISVLRKFDFTIEEISKIINDIEQSKIIIQNVKERNALTLASEQNRQQVLSQIDDSKAYTVTELAQELSAASKNIQYTEEKIKKSRKTIWSVIKSTLIFLIVWMPVALQFLFFTVTLIVYSYPRFYPEAKAYMVLSVLPSLFIAFLNRINRKWKKIAKVVLLVLCAVSLSCSLLVSKLPLGLLAQSETTDFEEYRDIDADCLANKDLFFQELFPIWPHYFENVIQSNGNWETVYLDAHYYYRYFRVMDYTYDIYAQWPLEEEAFNKEVDRVRELFEAKRPNYETIQKGNYICFFAYNGDPPFEKVTDSYTYYIFAYDEANLVVRYILCDSLENGADQPYYLSLEW